MESPVQGGQIIFIIKEANFWIWGKYRKQKIGTKTEKFEVKKKIEFYKETVAN